MAPRKSTASTKQEPYDRTGYEEDEYEVEAIVKHERIGSILNYLVSWVGYPGEDTWISSSDAVGADVIIKTYWDNLFARDPTLTWDRYYSSKPVGVSASTSGSPAAQYSAASKYTGKAATSKKRATKRKSSALMDEGDSILMEEGSAQKSPKQKAKTKKAAAPPKDPDAPRKKRGRPPKQRPLPPTSAPPQPTPPPTHFDPYLLPPISTADTVPRNPTPPIELPTPPRLDTPISSPSEAPPAREPSPELRAPTPTPEPVLSPTTSSSSVIPQYGSGFEVSSSVAAALMMSGGDTFEEEDEPEESITYSSSRSSREVSLELFLEDEVEDQGATPSVALQPAKEPEALRPRLSSVHRDGEAVVSSVQVEDRTSLRFDEDELEEDEVVVKTSTLRGIDTDHEPALFANLDERMQEANADEESVVAEEMSSVIVGHGATELDVADNEEMPEQDIEPPSLAPEQSDRSKPDEDDEPWADDEMIAMENRQKSPSTSLTPLLESSPPRRPPTMKQGRIPYSMPGYSLRSPQEIVSLAEFAEEDLPDDLTHVPDAIQGYSFMRNWQEVDKESNWEDLVKEILSVEPTKRGLTFCIVWKGHEKWSWVTSKHARLRCPRKVIEFYESRISI